MNGDQQLAARADDGAADNLTSRQRDVLSAILTYHEAVGEEPSVRYIARRLNLHHSTIQDHLSALQRKGWLRSGGAPVCVRRPRRN